MPTNGVLLSLQADMCSYFIQPPLPPGELAIHRSGVRDWMHGRRREMLQGDRQNGESDCVVTCKWAGRVVGDVGTRAGAAYASVHLGRYILEQHCRHHGASRCGSCSSSLALHAACVDSTDLS